MTTYQHATTEVLDRPDASPRERLLANVDADERRLELAGVSTAVLEAGNGPPLILLHGPMEFAARWMRVLPGLAETHHVIAPDLPGHGASHVSGGELDAGQVLAWLDALIEQTCESPPIVVGHILGGAIATRFAVSRSERIHRLVLVDTLGLASFRPSLRFAFALLRFTVRPTERSHEGLWQQCAADLDRVREDLGEQWDALETYMLERARDPDVRNALKTLMSSVGVPAIDPDELARITVPTVLVWGRHDRANRLRVAQNASERYGWPLHVIEDAGDDPAFEQPEAFLKALQSVLDES